LACPSISASDLLPPCLSAKLNQNTTMQLTRHDLLLHYLSHYFIGDVTARHDDIG